MKILLDGVTKYLTGTRQTKYIVCSSRKQQPDYWDRIRQATGQQEKTTAGKEHGYWQLQRNQEVIGQDNLLRGKFAKDQRKLNGVHNRKLKDIQRQIEKVQRDQEKIREAQEKERDLYWDPTRPMKKEEEIGRTTKEEESKSRCISAGVGRHHTDHQKIMVRAQYRSSSTTPRTKTHIKNNRSNTDSH